MTAPIDLEALRAALDDMGYARTVLECEGNFTPAECLEDAQRVVSEALAELTARRARDAEVAALVEAASDFSATMTHSISMTNLGAEWEGKPHPVPARHPVRVAIATLDAALLPFQRSDDKGDAT